MNFDWPYFDLVNGKLYDPRMVDRKGNHIPLFSNVNGKPAPHFANSAEAEQWLEDNDIRGSVR